MSASPNGAAAGDARPDRVIVGVDGSAGSRTALAWAADEAARRAADLLVVATWPLDPPPPSPPVVIDATRDQQPQPPSRAAVAVLDEMRADLESLRLDRERVTTLMEAGRPEHVLVELSATADLLVVGTHGRGLLRGFLLGSVSTYVAAHARCPVVVVPSTWVRR